MRTAVVILNWNGAEHLKRFLPSVVRTTPPGVRVVVADNGSDDGSPEWVARNHPAVEVVRLERNYGFAGGYNRALERVEADCYILLNSDVEPAPGWCSALVAALENDPSLGAVAPKIRSCADPARFEYAGAAGGFIDALGYPFCRGRILSTVEEDTGQYDTPRYTFWASGAAFCCRAEAFRAAGGFDEAFFAHMEEIDLCWRMQLLGWRIGSEPRSTVYHLGGGTLAAGSPRKAELNHRNNLAMLFKNLPAGRLWWVLPLRLLLDGASALLYLLAGKPSLSGAVWRAHLGFWSRLPRLVRQRRAIRSGPCARPEGIYPGSVMVRYLMGGRKFGRMM